ncbi:MAG: hypothetical protein ACRDK5_06185 [Solirubrobacterales bacterium]
MDEAIERALENDRTIDITTLGRRSGEPRRIEIWMHHGRFRPQARRSQNRGAAASR